MIVLAAGISARLGRDKAGLRRADGSTFLDHVVTAACASQPLLTLVVRRPLQDWPLSHADPQVRRIDCGEAGEGMAASLRCGLNALPPSVQAALVLLLDQPALDASHLQQLLARWREDTTRAVASVYAGVRGAPAVLPRSGFAALLRQRGDQGARSWLRAQSSVLEVDAPLLAQDVDHDGGWPEPVSPSR